MLLRCWRAGESGMMGASHFTQRCGAFLLLFFYAPPMPLSLTLSTPCMPHPCTLYAPFPHLECTIGACAMIQPRKATTLSLLEVRHGIPREAVRPFLSQWRMTGCPEERSAARPRNLSDLPAFLPSRSDAQAQTCNHCASPDSAHGTPRLGA